MARSSHDRPSFDDVFSRVQSVGMASVVSSRGTEYNVTALIARDGRRTLIARPRSGQVRIHKDCWGDDLTCQRTRAGGVYNGSPSIYDWYSRSR